MAKIEDIIHPSLKWDLETPDEGELEATSEMYDQLMKGCFYERSRYHEGI